MLASPVPQSASHLSDEVETGISGVEMGAVILLSSEDRCMAESVTEESPSWCAPHGPTQHRLKTPQLRITWSTCWCMGVGETASWPPAIPCVPFPHEAVSGCSHLSNEAGEDSTP